MAHQLPHAPKPASWVQTLAYSPDGRRLVSVAGLSAGWNPPYPRGAHLTEPGEVKVWDTSTGACLHTFPEYPGAVWSVAYSPDSRQIAAGYARDCVRLWDAATYRELPGSPVPVSGGVFDLKYACAGRLLAISSVMQVGVWDVDARTWKWRKDRHFPPGEPGKSALALSRDGQRLLFSLVRGGPPRAWDVRTGEELDPLPLPDGDIWQIAFSRDDQLLALATGDPHSPHVEIWDTTGHRLLNPLGSQASSILSVAFGPDDLLASGGQDHAVRLWRIDRRGFAEEVKVFRGHQAGVTCLAFSPDGTQLASGGEDSQILLWHATRDPRGLGLHFQETANGLLGEWLGNMAFAADGPRLLLVGQCPDGFRLKSWGMAAERRLSDHRLELRCFADEPPRNRAFSGDGRRLAGLDRTDPPRAVYVWDTESGQPITTVPMHRVDAAGVALSHDGHWLAVAGAPDPSGNGGESAARLTIIDTNSGEVVNSISGLPSPPANLAFSRDGHNLAAVMRRGDNGSAAAGEVVVLVFDPTTGRELRRLQAEKTIKPEELVFVQDNHQPLALAYSPDGRRLALAGPSNLLRVWEMTSGRECPFSPLKTASGLTGVTFSPDSRRLAATGYDGRVNLWDADAGHELLTLRGIGAPGSGHYTFTARVAFSPDGRYLAANDWNGTVFVWDAGPPR